MLRELIRTETTDNVPLVGLHFEPESVACQQVVVHVHGTSGNFYENPFIDYFASFYPSKGYSFMTVNLRGHDTYGATEHFDDCLLDLEAWMKVVWGRGYETVLLQGHSLGAIKIVRFVSSFKLSMPRIAGLVLLSPVDVIAQYCHGSPDSRNAQVSAASALAAIQPSAFVPADVWDQYPISAETFLDLVGPDTRADVFPFRLGSLAQSVLATIDVPVLAFVGGDDPVMYPSPLDCSEQLGALSNVKSVLVKAAPHNFAGRESVVLDDVANWLDLVDLRSAISD